jgi:hypothetical protein
LRRHLGTALERFRRLAHHEGRAGHRLDPARDGEIDLAAAYRAGGLADRVEPGGAEAVDRDPRNAVRQSGKQQRHAGDVAVVLAGLVGAAVEHVVERGPVRLGIASDERPDGHGREIVGAHLGKGATVTTDRRSHRIADEGIAHRSCS